MQNIYTQLSRGMYYTKIIWFCVWMLQLWLCCDAYRNIRLQDYLCSDKFILAIQQPFRGNPHFTLTEEGDSAAVIAQVWNTSLPGLHATTNKIKYNCDFGIKTLDKPPRGIYTIITRLKFRQDVATGKCVDYIQFSGGNRSPSEKICNDISIDGPAGRLIFDQRDRDLNVHIHIEKSRMIHEPLELRMVLTAHTECKYTGDFQCDKNDQYSCISRHFYRDNITNCMYPCHDEVSCFHDAITADQIDTANVAISAITSLIFTMLGVGFCIWICWKYWNCITVQQHAHEASAAAHRSRPHYSIDTPTIELPTAPSYDVAVTSSTSDQQQQQHQLESQTPKDLPPSYDSLFPER